MNIVPQKIFLMTSRPTAHFTLILHGSNVFGFDVFMHRGWRYTHICLLDHEMAHADTSWFVSILENDYW